MNWADEIGKQLIKQVNIKIGNNESIAYNVGKKVNIFNYKDGKLEYVEIKDK
jgi:hypothetical protein